MKDLLKGQIYRLARLGAAGNCLCEFHVLYTHFKGGVRHLFSTTDGIDEVLLHLSFAPFVVGNGMFFEFCISRLADHYFVKRWAFKFDSAIASEDP